jgi:ribonuclease HI
MVAAPHYLLFSEASCSAESRTWRFVLQDVESRRRMVVSDEEDVTCGERLELLAVVRGLEALDGPARVTLVTKSRYVSRGLRFGMTEWRANDWQWERFGRVVPVKDHDLWQRVDRALLFHQVECQAWQFEEGVVEEPQACESVRPAEVTADCSDRSARACEPASVPALAENRLSPTRHRGAARSRVRKRRLGPQNAGLQRSLANALVTKAASLRDTLQSLVDPDRRLATGAA